MLLGNLNFYEEHLLYLQLGEKPTYLKNQLIKSPRSFKIQNFQSLQSQSQLSPCLFTYGNFNFYLAVLNLSEEKCGQEIPKEGTLNLILLSENMFLQKLF